MMRCDDGSYEDGMVARTNRRGSVGCSSSYKLEENLHRLRSGRITKRERRAGPGRMRSGAHWEQSDARNHMKAPPTNANFTRRGNISSSALPEPDILSSIDSCGLCMASQCQRLSSHSVNAWCSRLHYLEQTPISKSPFEIQPSTLPIHKTAKYLLTSQSSFCKVPKQLHSYGEDDNELSSRFEGLGLQEIGPNIKRDLPLQHLGVEEIRKPDSLVQNSRLNANAHTDGFADNKEKADTITSMLQDFEL